MTDFSKLITKEQAAALLGVSRATFDRCRDRLGLHPVPSILKKPLVFDRDAVAAVLNVECQLSPTRTAKTLLERTRLVPLRTVRALAKKVRAK